MQKQEDLQMIKQELSILRHVIQSNVNDGHYDINLECENFYRDLLNILWDCNLKNLNVDKKNAKAIDLIDYEKKIAIQITSDKSLTKIRTTIKNFEDTYNKSEYRLYILNILSKSEHEEGCAQYADKTNYDFKDSIDVDDILLQIEDCEAKKINQIRKCVESNLGYYKRFFKEASSLSNFFESSAKPYSTLNGLKEIVYVDDNYKAFLDDFYVALKAEPLEIRKAVWLYLTKCECEETLNLLYLQSSKFFQYIKEVGLNERVIYEHIETGKILHWSTDCNGILIESQEHCCSLKKIKDKVLESIISGPDFSLFDSPLEIMDS